MTIEEFGKTIKVKYPQYQDIPDADLGTKMIAKYPVYKDQITAGTQQPFKYNVQETPQERANKIARYQQEASVSNTEAKKANSLPGFLGNFGKAFVRNVAHAPTALGDTIGGVINTNKYAGTAADLDTQASGIQANLVKLIREKKARSEDTSKLEKEYNNLVGSRENTTGTFNQIFAPTQKTNSQVVGELAGTALDVLTAGTYGKVANAGAKGFQLTRPVTKALPTVVKTVQGATGLFSGKGAAKIVTGAGIGYAGDVAYGLQEGKEDPFAPGIGTAIGLGIPLAIHGVQSGKNAVTAVKQKGIHDAILGNNTEKLITKRTNELSKLENNNSVVRKAVKKAKDKGIDVKNIVANTDLLADSVDNTGTMRTENAIHDLNDFIKPQEDVISSNLQKEGRKVPLGLVEREMKRAINESSLKGGAKLRALRAVDEDVAGLLLDADKDKYISLSTIHDAKVDKYSNINYMNPESNKTDKVIAKVYKTLVENNTKSVDVKNLNAELARHYQVQNFLEKLDGKKVKGAQLGKYFAKTVGAIAGSSMGPLGAIAGSEVSGAIQGKMMKGTFAGKIGKKLEQSSAMIDAVKSGKPNATIELPAGQDYGLPVNTLNNAQPKRLINSKAITDQPTTFPTAFQSSSNTSNQANLRSLRAPTANIIPIATENAKPIVKSNIPQLSKTHNVLDPGYSGPGRAITGNVSSDSLTAQNRRILDELRNEELLKLGDKVQDQSTLMKLINKYKSIPNKKGGFVRNPLTGTKVTKFTDFVKDDQSFLVKFANKVRGKQSISDSELRIARETLQSYDFVAPESKTRLADLILTAKESADQRLLDAQMSANMSNTLRTKTTNTTGTNRYLRDSSGRYNGSTGRIPTIKRK